MDNYILGGIYLLIGAIIFLSVTILYASINIKSLFNIRNKKITSDYINFDKVNYESI